MADGSPASRITWSAGRLDVSILAPCSRTDAAAIAGTTTTVADAAVQAADGRMVAILASRRRPLFTSSRAGRSGRRASHWWDNLIYCATTMGCAICAAINRSGTTTPLLVSKRETRIIAYCIFVGKNTNDSASDLRAPKNNYTAVSIGLEHL